MELILSGIGSAIIAALITILLQCWFEKVGERKSAILNTVAWIDTVTTRLQALSVYKLALSKGKDMPISDSEYNTMSNELRLAILSNLVLTEIRCAYGESDILGKVAELHKDLTTVARRFWTSTLEEWATKNDEVIKSFSDTIEPKIEVIMNKLFHGLKLKSLVCK